MEYAASLEELAYHLNTSRSQVHRWRLAGCPVAKSARGYAVRRVRRWIEKNAVRRGDGESSVSQDLCRQKLEADLGFRKARAEIAKFELELARGNLVSVQEIKDDWGPKLRAFRDRVLALPRQISPELAGLTASEIERILLTRLRAILDDLDESMVDGLHSGSFRRARTDTVARSPPF